MSILNDEQILDLANCLALQDQDLYDTNYLVRIRVIEKSITEWSESYGEHPPEKRINNGI